MDRHNAQLERRGYGKGLTYSAADFDRMLAETKSDAVIVTAIDASSHTYTIRSLDTKQFMPIADQIDDLLK